MKTIRSKDQVWQTAVELAARLTQDHDKNYAIKTASKVFQLTPLEASYLNDAINANLFIEACNG